MGRLTKDPDERVNTRDNSAVTRFTIAVDKRFKRDGDPEADFFNCVSFGKLAEFAGRYLRKGTKIVMDGEIHNDNYDDKNGVKHYNVQIIAHNIEFAESKKSSGETRSQDNNYMTTVDVDEEDIPFN